MERWLASGDNWEDLRAELKGISRQERILDNLEAEANG